MNECNKITSSSAIEGRGSSGRAKKGQNSLLYCLQPSIPLVCLLRLLAFAIAALDLDAALDGACVGVSLFSGTGDVAAIPNLLSARREPLAAVLVRGNLLLAAAEEVRLLAEGAAGMELTLRLFQLLLVCEPALLSRLTGR